MEHTRPEQVELRPPVHLTFDQLQPVDLAFELAVTPPVDERVLYRLVILADPSGEPDELLQLTLGHGS